MEKTRVEKIWYATTVVAAAVAEVSIVYFAKWAARKFSVDLVHRMNSNNSNDEE